MTPYTYAGAFLVAFAVGLCIPSLLARVNAWAQREVDAMCDDALNHLGADVSLPPNVRAMRQEQMSSDWAMWREEMSR